MKYEDLKAAYEQRSTVRLIERLPDIPPYDMIINQGDNLIVQHPRRSEKKHSSRSHKRVQFKEGDITVQGVQPTEMIMSNNPINRVPGHVTPQLVAMRPQVVPSVIQSRMTSQPILQNMSVAPMIQTPVYDVYRSVEPANQLNYETRGYTIGDVERMTNTPHLSSIRNLNSEYGGSIIPGAYSTGHRDDQGLSHPGVPPSGYQSVNLFESVGPLRHTPTSRANSQNRQGLSESIPLAPDRDYYGPQNTAQDTRDFQNSHRPLKSISSRIAAERLQPDRVEHSGPGYQQAHGDNKVSKPRPDERGSLDYSKGEISYLTFSPMSSKLRPSNE